MLSQTQANPIELAKLGLASRPINNVAWSLNKARQHTGLYLSINTFGQKNNRPVWQWQGRWKLVWLRKIWVVRVLLRTRGGNMPIPGLLPHKAGTRG